VTVAGLVLRARHLLPGAGAWIENGWVFVERGRIKACGLGRPTFAGRARPAIDLGDAIIVPGLVNAHTHLEFSRLESPLDAAGGLPAWIRRIVNLRRGRAEVSAGHSPGDIAAAIRAGCAESAAAGVTAIGEIATDFGPEVIAAYASAGPRLRVFREAIGLAADGGQGSRRLAADLDRLVARGLAAGISPHAPYTVAAPLAARLAREIARRRLPVAMHVAESSAEAQLLRDSSGDFRVLLDEFGAWPQDASPRLFSAADWISWLARAPRGIVVHGTHLPDDETALARLARHRDRLAVVVCPRTTRALSGVLPPVAAFRAAGIRVALGTDGRGSNPDLSVLAECRTLVDAGLARPAEALAMATRDAAWALLLERTSGRIAVGRPADLVVLRPARPHADPAAAAIDPATRVVATLRAGRVIAGSLG
jgi:cytosine/adenosine deaminase-related metal-dependent hydrolase